MLLGRALTGTTLVPPNLRRHFLQRRVGSLSGYPRETWMTMQLVGYIESWTAIKLRESSVCLQSPHLSPRVTEDATISPTTQLVGVAEPCSPGKIEWSVPAPTQGKKGGMIMFLKHGIFGYKNLLGGVCRVFNGTSKETATDETP